MLFLHKTKSISVEEGKGVIGTGPAMSNNVAEFFALTAGLLAVERRLPASGASVLQVRGDSNLVIQVMSGKWTAKWDKLYYKTYVAARYKLTELTHRGCVVHFDHVPREQNTRCDELSKAHQSEA